MELRLSSKLTVTTNKVNLYRVRAYSINDLNSLCLPHQMPRCSFSSCTPKENSRTRCLFSCSCTPKVAVFFFLYTEGRESSARSTSKSLCASSLTRCLFSCSCTPKVGVFLFLYTESRCVGSMSSRSLCASSPTRRLFSCSCASSRCTGAGTACCCST